MHNLYLFLFSWRSIKKWAPAIVLIILFYSAADAQYRGGDGQESDSHYGISIGSDYDSPVGNLAYTFKPAINYNINFLKQNGDFTMSVSLGYHEYKPKADTFYYAVTNTDYGTEEYKNFTVTSLYIGGTYNYPATDHFRINAGVNLGLYYTHLYFHAADFTSVANDDLHESDLYIAARLGFTYMLSDHIGIGAEAKYNFFAPTGDSDYDDRVGTLYFSWSAGFRLTYIF